MSEPVCKIIPREEIIRAYGGIAWLVGFAMAKRPGEPLPSQVVRALNLFEAWANEGHCDTLSWDGTTPAPQPLDLHRTNR